MTDRLTDTLAENLYTRTSMVTYWVEILLVQNASSFRQIENWILSDSVMCFYGSFPTFHVQWFENKMKKDVNKIKDESN